MHNPLSSFSPFACFCLPHIVPAARISGVLPDTSEPSSSCHSSLVGQQLQRQKNIPAYVTFFYLCTLLALGSVHVILWLAVDLSFMQTWKQHSSQQ